MAVRPKRYYELADKINIAAHNFYKIHGIIPNTVIVNDQDYYLLKDTNHYLTGASLDEEPKFAGMRVQVIPLAKEISVGYMEFIKQ